MTTWDLETKSPPRPPVPPSPPLSLLSVVPLLLHTSVAFISAPPRSIRHDEVVRPNSIRKSQVALDRVEERDWGLRKNSNSQESPFRLARKRSSVELQTAFYKLSAPSKRSTLGRLGGPLSIPGSTLPGMTEGVMTTGSIFSPGIPEMEKRALVEASDVEVDLVSMVHLGDASYYRDIVLDMAGYDRVLFELIAENDVVVMDGEGRKTVKQRIYPTREQEVLGRSYGLFPQLDCLNYRLLCSETIRPPGRTPTWVLADLSPGEIQGLQEEQNERKLGEPGWRGAVEEVTRTLVVGRGAKGGKRGGKGGGDSTTPDSDPARPLHKRVLDGSNFIIRLLLWLTPCPEAEIMLLDWARTYPRAGGLSSLLTLVVERALAGDLSTARKLGFAQQLASSSANNGAWGQSSEVIVKARNEVVVKEVERALGEGCQRVAVLYGGLHMEDLQGKLREQLGIRQREPVEWRPAWVIPVGRDASLPGEAAKAATGAGGEDGVEGPAQTLVSEEERRRWGTLALVGGIYVAVGAWDWTDTVVALTRAMTSITGGGEPLAEGIGSAVAVVVLYLTRHAYLYYGLAKWIVEWDKGLF